MNESGHVHESLLRRWLKRMEVDQAVFFALVTRSSQLLASPVTTLLLATLFTDELRDYYGLLWWLVGLQVFADFGFQLAIVHVASHEWAGLQLSSEGDVQGDPRSLARLARLARLAAVWNSTAALLFVPSVSLVGYYFLAQKSTTIPWLAPMGVLVVLAAASLGVSGLIALLEGCNQVARVQRYRFLQAISGYLVVWTAILSGANLWVAVAASAVQLAWEVYLVAVVYRRFWRSLGSNAEPENVDIGLSWQRDVWSLQWRIGIQTIAHFFAYNSFVPVMWSHPKALAGQFFMTWTVLTAFQSASFTWVQMRMPRFGMLVANREFAELDRIFWRLTWLSWGVLLGVATLFWCGLVVVGHIPSWLTDRLAAAFLPPLPVLILIVGVASLHVPRSLVAYLRSHKQDPLWRMLLVANSIMALAVFILGRRYGAVGAASGFAAVVVAVIVPCSLSIWYRCRQEWHGGEE